MTVPTSQNAPDALPERMSQLLTSMVERLVDDPDAVRVEADTSDSGINFRLFVAPDDLGKVIGKQGRTARSLRTILSAIGSKADHRMQLDVLENPDLYDDEEEDEAADTEEA